MIGRSEELASVDRFLARASCGSAVLVLEGAAGIGKTTILEAAVDAAGAAGFRVLRARPAESERGLTLGGLTDLFAAIDEETLGALPSPSAGRWRSRSFESSHPARPRISEHSQSR
jgi:hypothetical protein